MDLARAVSIINNNNKVDYHILRTINRIEEASRARFNNPNIRSKRGSHR